MAILKYDSLDVSLRQLRLLTLLPGRWDDVIHCQLATASLDDLPEYETISYVWGDSNLRNSIVVDDCSFLVTINLEQALRRFRRSQVPRFMWADAICINQEDTNERSQQVAMMGEIYKQCRQVQIWIGEEDDLVLPPLSPEALYYSYFVPENIWPDLEKSIEFQHMRYTISLSLSSSHDGKAFFLDVPAALELLGLLDDDKHFYEMPFFEIAADHRKVVMCSKWLLARRSLVNILARPWWTRIWTIQEAILPVKATVNLGPHSADLQLFMKACCYFWKHFTGPSCCSFLGYVPWMTIKDDSIDFITLMGSLFSLRRKKYDGYKSPFTAAFSLATERECTDPHDCIYGILGLVPGLLPNGTLPSYATDISSLYCHATKMLYYNSASLLSLGWANSIDANPYKLPSWALNWNKKRRQEHQFWENPSYDACGFHVFGVSSPSTLSDRILPVEGTFAGSVDQATNSVMDSQNLVDIKQILEDAQKVAMAKSAVDGESFLRTIFIDRLFFDNGTIQLGFREKMAEDDLIIARNWLNRILSDGQDNLSAYPSDELFWACHARSSGILERKKFFSCNTSLFGIGPSRIRENDRLFVVKGSQVPLILRPAESQPEQSTQEISGQAYYSFVGGCYVHGIIHGEAITGDVKWESLLLC